jgi:TolA-binding protein
LAQQDHDEAKAREKALQDRLDEYDCCMCGSRMSEHGIGSGHSPVSMHDYRLDQAEAREKVLQQRVEELEEAIQLAQELHKDLYEQAERLQERLDQIRTWCDAYPLDIFPEPDLKEARRLLEAGGMTLDAVSAQAMRHVLNGIRIIIEEEGK